MSDDSQVPSAEFADIKDAASKFIDAQDTQAPDAPVADAAISVEGQAPVVPVVTSAELEELDPTVHGERKVKVKIDGEWQVVSLREAADGYSRTQNYTRNKQALATERAEIEGSKAEFAQLRQESQQTRAFLNNPQMVMQYLKQAHPQLFQQAQQQPIGQPDEIATIDQANQLIEQKFNFAMAQMQQSLQATEKKLTEATVKAQNLQETSKYIEALTPTFKSVFEAHPILAAIPNSEDNIRYEVAKLKPRNLAEAQAAIAEVAQGMAETLEQAYTNQNKTKLAAAGKLKARIEPPGGSGPQLQPAQTHTADGKVDWKSITNLAKARAQQAGS